MKWVLNCNDRFVIFHAFSIAAHGQLCFLVWAARVQRHNMTPYYKYRRKSNPRKNNWTTR